jgi:hypothetical protein
MKKIQELEEHLSLLAVAPLDVLHRTGLSFTILHVDAQKIPTLYDTPWCEDTKSFRPTESALQMCLKECYAPPLSQPKGMF